MCTYSMIADFYKDRWEPQIPEWPGVPIKPYIATDELSKDELRRKILELLAPNKTVTEREFQELKNKYEQLKKEMEMLRDLLGKAKEYDIKNNEPDCEMDEKVEFIKKLAEYLGVDITPALPENIVQIPITSGTTVTPNIGSTTYTHSNDGV